MNIQEVIQQLNSKIPNNVRYTAITTQKQTIVDVAPHIVDGYCTPSIITLSDSSVIRIRGVKAVDLAEYLKHMMGFVPQKWRRYTVSNTKYHKPIFYVYFIQGTLSRNIKIGVAKNVEKRMGEIQRMSPDRLVLLGTLAGGYKKETELHQRFKRLRLHGEWFYPHQSLLDYIETLREE